MAMLTYHDPDALIAPKSAPVDPRPESATDDDVDARWLQSLSLPHRLFVRFYRALRKLQPMFPPLSCC
ncbi:hypothetical protein ACTZWT_21255 [Rhodopseudomonas sp. NSM]|uniref:hypothetical protein n=1 Tax=Rhodopseudomonas sp. NSM TaxID=3457630 RepID=UPI004035314C